MEGWVSVKKMCEDKNKINKQCAKCHEKIHKKAGCKTNELRFTCT
jgi:hypothetical protein